MCKLTEIIGISYIFANFTGSTQWNGLKWNGSYCLFPFSPSSVNPNNYLSIYHGLAKYIFTFTELRLSVDIIYNIDADCTS